MIYEDFYIVSKEDATNQFAQAKKIYVEMKEYLENNIYNK